MTVLLALVLTVVWTAAGVYETVQGSPYAAVTYLTLASMAAGSFVAMRQAETRLAIESRSDWRRRYELLAAESRAEMRERRLRPAQPDGKRTEYCPGYQRPSWARLHADCRIPDEVGHGPHWFEKDKGLRGCCLTPVSEPCKCERPEGLPGWMPWPVDEDPAPETTAAIFRLDMELAQAAASRALLDTTITCVSCGRRGAVAVGPHLRPDGDGWCQK